MSHMEPNDEFGCQECGECTLIPPHGSPHNCSHDRAAGDPERLLHEELRVTNSLLRELIGALGGAG